MEIKNLKQTLKNIWSKETCSPSLKDNWNKNNPSIGQCAITSLLVNDLYGGKIMRCMIDCGSHYYNLINNKIIDLTVEQFLGEIPKYELGEERTREYLLSNEDTKNRYLLLKSRLENYSSKTMDDKIKSAVEFYLLATKLKYKIRSAWDDKHWPINNDRLESIAEHVYGTCILALSFDSQFDLNVDINKVLTMLTLHEIGEVLIGDITPFDNVTEEEKASIEHKAMLEVLKDLDKKDEYFNLLLEFDERNTPESRFAYLCDKMEFDLQFKVYQDKGYHNDLNNQKNNVVFNSSKVKEYINNGAKEPFDIAYEYDKDKYEGEKIFQKTLKYIKDNKIII